MDLVVDSIVDTVIGSVVDWVVDSFLDLVVDLFVDSGFEIRGRLVLQLRLLFVLIYIFCQHYALVSQKSIVTI